MEDRRPAVLNPASPGRYLVIAALFVLSLITYIDRVCISSAKQPLSADLGLSDQAMGAVFSAFALGYALAQIPSGWLADRFGPRITLAAVVSVWSLFTAWTGAVNGYISLLLVRFFFGIAEAGAFPGSARAIMNWLPPEERGRANGVLFSGSRLGAALAFPLLAWMLTRWQWRMSFGILGLAGAVWAICWLLLFRNHPAAAKTQDRGVESGKGSLGKLLGSRPALLAMAQYLAGNFTFFICLSWMLPYLKEHYRLSDADAAGYAMIPLLFAAGSQWITGFLVDRLYGSRFRSWSRRLPAASGFFLATTGLLALTTAESPFAAVACFTLAAFGADMSISPSWAYCMDVGKKNAGSLSGAMNMVGNLGSFISANAFPFLFGWTGSANSYFYLAAALNLMAIGCWLAMKPPAEGAAGKSHE